MVLTQENLRKCLLALNYYHLLQYQRFEIGCMKIIRCTYLWYKKLTDMVPTKKIFRAWPPTGDEISVWGED